MNLHTTGIIISREYLNKVKKKSFLITTFLVPILFAALCILPSLIMLGTKESSKNIAVVDNSGIVAPALENSETATRLSTARSIPPSRITVSNSRA